MEVVLVRPRVEKENLRSLTESGASQAEIACTLGCSPSYISKLERCFGIKRKHYWENNDIKFLTEHYLDLTYGEIATLLERTPGAVKNKRYRLELDLIRLPNPWSPSPTPDLAYVLGVLKGDGHVRRNGQSFGLNCNDESFALAFIAALEKIGLRPKNKFYRQQWYVWDCNKDFADWYLGLDLAALEEYVESPEMARAFITGFYDSEGSLERTNHQKGYNHHAIVFWNSDRGLLELTQRLLAQCSLHSVLGLSHKQGRQSMYKGKTIISRKDGYRLGIYRQAHVDRFLREIGSNIQRKGTKIG